MLALIESLGHACLSWAFLYCCLSPLAGVTSKKLSEMYVELGDLGDVAARCKGRQRMLMPLPPLTVDVVFSKMQAIASAKGPQSSKRKQQLVASLLRACR
jgi:ATP-dependent DNA ligase